MNPLIKQKFSLTDTFICNGHFVTIRANKYIVSKRYNKHISIAIFDTPLQVQVFCNKDKFQN
jgi:hypothetical protein